MTRRRRFRSMASLFGGALAAVSLLPSAFAATHEQIVAKCRETARPAVVACVRSKGGGRGSEAIIEACRQSVGKPIVYGACCVRSRNKRAG